MCSDSKPNIIETDQKKPVTLPPFAQLSAKADSMRKHRPQKLLHNVTAPLPMRPTPVIVPQTPITPLEQPPNRLSDVHGNCTDCFVPSPNSNGSRARFCLRKKFEVIREFKASKIRQRDFAIKHMVSQENISRWKGLYMRFNTFEELQDAINRKEL